MLGTWLWPSSSISTGWVDLPFFTVLLPAAAATALAVLLSLFFLFLDIEVTLSKFSSTAALAFSVSFVTRFVAFENMLCGMRNFLYEYSVVTRLWFTLIDKPTLRVQEGYGCPELGPVPVPVRYPYPLPVRVTHTHAVPYL
ncbi:hypothetical protein BU15DRAFT_69302 [Melanogaster broomeanus]|nr:hypothetical protein BU15DRAFT_69302 [Melanogaster broomeanus]